jgi:hypothetical protein
VTASGSQHATFFEGFRPSAMVIGAIGSCLFLAGFFVKGVNGIGRALGLLGIGIVLCAIIANLLLGLAGCTDLHHRRHAITQAIFTSLLAVAILALAGYLYHYGHLPPFMPARYNDDYHVKRLTDLRRPVLPVADRPAV